MKKNRRSCTQLILLAGGAITLLLLVGFFYSFLFSPNILDEKRALASPPSIMVLSPQAGDTALPGATLLTQAAVTAMNPIVQVEVWLDGKAVGKQIPESQDKTTFYVFFELEIGAGTHMLFWRAVDNNGLVGQSAPIPIAGVFPPGTGEIITVSAEFGQSLEDIAKAQGVDPGVLRDLNPQLGEYGLFGGTTVNIPAPSGQVNGNQQQADNNAPTPSLPNPPAGIPALLPANIPVIDWSTFTPALLNNLPAAPSHLQAGFGNCTIRLVWNDNAENENYFKVWMQALGGPPLHIKTLQARAGTGQTWFEFTSPSFGIYSFWVEAVNGLGSQPSIIAWVAVNDTNCGEGIASQLEIEALRMRGFSNNWDRIYCYLSIEEAPEKRIPEDANQFFQKDFLGGADIHNWIGGRYRILIKMPADEEVTLNGDCWGWLGDNPASMGDFSTSIPKEQWDNRDLQIGGTNYVIDFRIRPFGSTQAKGAFTYLDPGIPVPYGLSVDELKADYDPHVTEIRMRTPTVRWQWNGNLEEITGFTVHVDGVRAAWVEPIGKILPGNPPTSVHRATLLLPSACGAAYQIQAAANSENAQSVLSNPIEYRQLPCDYQSSIQSFPLHWYYWSQFDGNELWLVSNDSGGKKQVELVTKDITNFVAGKLDYRQSGFISPRRLHNPADEPNVTPYYYFEFIQQKVEFAGQPIYHDAPISSESFAVGVNHLGSGWKLLRETMLLFDATGYPVSRFEQIYRGTDGQLYLYRPATRELKLLWDTINEGYRIYKLSDFD